MTEGLGVSNDLLSEQKYTEENRARIIQRLPPKLVAKEEGLLPKFQRNKGKPLRKLELLFEFMDELLVKEDLVVPGLLEVDPGSSCHRRGHAVQRRHPASSFRAAAVGELVLDRRDVDDKALFERLSEKLYILGEGEG